MPIGTFGAASKKDNDVSRKNFARWITAPAAFRATTWKTFLPMPMLMPKAVVSGSGLMRIPSLRLVVVSPDATPGCGADHRGHERTADRRDIEAEAR